jgi:methylmalonyl-CoA mutase N-terminal domain/subunit
LNIQAKNAQIQLHFQFWLLHEAGATADTSLVGIPSWDGLGIHLELAYQQEMKMKEFVHVYLSFWVLGMNHFMEIAMTRAGRMIWAKLQNNLTTR